MIFSHDGGSPPEAEGQRRAPRNFRSDITIDPSGMTQGRIAASVSSLTNAMVAFERRIAKPNIFYAHRAILVRTMARAADDELGVGMKVAVGFAMRCPSRSGCLALRVA